MERPASKELHDAALAYAARGWYVFPCAPGEKRPLTPHGCKDATTDPDQIKTWWTKWPTANIGIACGPSGLVVIDSDAKNGQPGLESWRDITEGLGPEIAETPTVETPGPGLQMYYGRNGHVVSNSAGKLGPGIDVRSEGGYVIAPPSVHPNGGIYSWAMDYAPDEIALRPLPDDIAERLASPAPKAAPARPGASSADPSPGEAYLWLGRALDRAKTGSRNDTGFWLACQLRDANIKQEDAEPILLQYAQSVPDNPADPYTETEALHSLDEAYGTTPRAPAVNLGLAPTISYTMMQHLANPHLLSEIAKLPLTDAGNAEAFYLMHGNQFRYLRQRADGHGHWLVWRGHYWEPCLRGEPERAALLTVRTRLAAAAAIQDDGIRKAALLWARKSESSYAVRAMLEQARNIIEPFATIQEDWDTNLWTLACENGVIDLHTGTLRPGVQEELISKSTRISYDPEAECPRWERFLQEVFDGDEALIRYIQKAAGYSLTGNISYPAVFFCHGTGRNGKSTLLNWLTRVMGDYATSASFNTFIEDERGRQQNTNDLAELAGRRLVTARETKENQRLNESRIKLMTGGDPVKCRFLYAEFFEYVPQYHIWLAMNHKPRVSGTDVATWARIKCIPFEQCFEGREDRALDVTLAKEMPGILAWAVRGCLAWQEEGLDEPDVVKIATEEYREENDTFSGFLNECCVLAPNDPNTFITAERLHGEYDSWCDEMGISRAMRLRGRAVGSRLEALKCTKGRRSISGKQYRVWQGLALIGTPTNRRLSLDGLDGLDGSLANSYKEENDPIKNRDWASNPSNPSSTGQSDQDLEPESTSVSVPIMITARMKRLLLDHGYTLEEIGHMTPADAWERIERMGGLPEDEDTS